MNTLLAWSTWSTCTLTGARQPAAHWAHARRPCRLLRVRGPLRLRCDGRQRCGRAPRATRRGGTAARSKGHKRPQKVNKSQQLVGHNRPPCGHSPLQKPYRRPIRFARGTRAAPWLPAQYVLLTRPLLRTRCALFLTRSLCPPRMRTPSCPLGGSSRSTRVVSPAAQWRRGFRSDPCGGAGVQAQPRPRGDPHLLSTYVYCNSTAAKMPPPPPHSAAGLLSTRYVYGLLAAAHSVSCACNRRVMSGLCRDIHYIHIYGRETFVTPAPSRFRPTLHVRVHIGRGLCDRKTTRCAAVRLPVL